MSGLLYVVWDDIYFEVGGKGYSEGAVKDCGADQLKSYVKERRPKEQVNHHFSSVLPTDWC